MNSIRTVAGAKGFTVLSQVEDASCPLSRVTRKTFAQTELFSV